MSERLPRCDLLTDINSAGIKLYFSLWVVKVLRLTIVVFFWPLHAPCFVALLCTLRRIAFVLLAHQRRRETCEENYSFLRTSGFAAFP